ncbi:MAG: type I-E CRISPR-associated protein Cas7/Cse4/CasC [Eubacteriaceae bacterium]|nr:type I-E CRISPR-associated protein Cas7/Cse4/CasC [Eubacteriaceae bacterium]
MSNLYLDMHIIQTVPPSCLNRDDTGSPKTAMFGGSRRARVSSQSWKRAIRLMFKENLDMSLLGQRTLLLFDYIAAEIMSINPSLSQDEALELSKSVLDKAGIKEKADGKVEALFFIGSQQARNLAQIAVDGVSDEVKKDIISAIKDNQSIEVALFGRMVASNPQYNCDATAQVAHAISTHRVETEFDYFTAVDDLSPEDSTGAGMIGTIEYNASTLYRYATVAVHGLHKSLSSDATATAAAVKEFARAFTMSMPSGKQNTFANLTPPDMMYAVLRADTPLNFAGAFESPIKTSDTGFVKPSIDALAAYADEIYASFAQKPSKEYVVSRIDTAFGESLPLTKMLDSLEVDILDGLE